MRTDLYTKDVPDICREIYLARALERRCNGQVFSHLAAHFQHIPLGDSCYKAFPVRQTCAVIVGLVDIQLCILLKNKLLESRCEIPGYY